MTTKPVQTAIIKQTVQQFASDSITPLDQCDFILHGVITYIKTCHMETFAKYTEKYKEEYSDTEKLVNDRVVFRQIYKISLQKKKTCELKLDYTIEPGDYNTQPQMIIKPTSMIPYERYKPQELFTLITREINKIKAWNGMIIGLFSEPMIQDIKKFVKQIYTKRFTDDVSILLFNGIEPELAKPSKLILHFQKKSQDRQISEVEVGELIVEYIKPVYGHNGINALGRRVSRGEAQNEPFMECEIDKATIEVSETDEMIKLYSKKRGFVHYEPKKIEISNKVTLENVKRVQSQVAKEEQNEVEVVITQDDITHDSVGEGVHLTSETIHISGHIADKAKLEAKKLIIDGATHTGAKLFAREAVINRHKGVVRCHKAEIKLLEGGEVHGTHVHIENALGGMVFAEQVTISNVRHHLKVFATESITIKNLTGEDNLFTIDYSKIPIMQSRLEYIEEDIDEQRYYLDEAKRHREKDIPKINKRINTLKEEIREIKESCFHATITIQNRLNGLNTIRFGLPKNKEISFRTKEGIKYEPFYLERDEDDVTLQPVGVTLTL
ncbi:MAG: flagellar assembly protein A [Sulfurimonadaceae bacterium]|nr:flagellar assembly protein A [Sulfurimonadaceae bacterium]